MKLKSIKSIVTTLLATIAVTTASAQIPQGYYDSLKGKKGAELKNAVHEIIKKANTLGYGSGKGNTWYGFWQTDRTSDGKFIDRYSPKSEWVASTSQGAVGSGMNIEHSFPKSWWGGGKNQAYCDLYNLMPCESKINSSKSNYPMGKVTNVKTTNGATKIGTGSDGKLYWEPADEWKGDFARGYMYMATCYQNLSWTGSQALQILQQGSYPTLQKWAYTLFIEWAKTDQVNTLEVTRNNAVSKIQGNRNPFVDFPNLMEYIWGDSVNYAFDPAKTMTAEKYISGGGSTDPDQPKPGDNEETVYTANYKSTDGGCTLELIKNPSETFNVWTRDAKYGWKASGYIAQTKTNTESEGYVVTPELDLTGMVSATLEFKHAVNFDTNPSERLSVEVRCEDNTTKLDGITWPTGKDWKFVESGSIDLSKFAGKKIKIAFHYTSTTATAGTWEISDIAVKGNKQTTGIGSVDTTAMPAFDPSKPYTIYDISGRRINGINNAKGIVIVKQQGRTFKLNR